MLIMNSYDLDFSSFQNLWLLHNGSWTTSKTTHAGKFLETKTKFQGTNKYFSDFTQSSSRDLSARVEVISSEYLLLCLFSQAKLKLHHQRLPRWATTICDVCPERVSLSIASNYLPFKSIENHLQRHTSNQWDVQHENCIGNKTSCMQHTTCL